MRSLTESENIVQAFRDPILVLDGDLRVRSAGAAFYHHFKVTPEQTLNRLVGELGDGQWASPALAELLEGVLKSGDAAGPDVKAGGFDDFPIEHDFPGIGHRSMLVNGRMMAGNGAAGSDVAEPLVLLGIRDVTNIRRLEAEVFQRQEWFRVTLGCIGDAVIATDAGARVTYLNPSAEELTGWSEAEARGQLLTDVFHIVNETTRELVDSPVAKALRLGAIVGLANHTLLIGKDGFERSIDDSAAPIRDANDNVVGVVMVFHDISARRKDESKLLNSEVRYRRLFESAHDGILILDTTSRKITDVNPFLLNLLHYPRDYFIAKELWEIGVFRDKAANQKAMEDLARDGSIRFENMPLLDRDGHPHPVEIVANLYDEGGQKVIQCNIRDISARARFDRERSALLANEQASRMQAESANRSKDLFLAILSHEVRTPLNAILGWATILRSGKCKDAEVKEGMEVIERNCRVQAQLIEDVMDVSRITSGIMRLDIRPCQLTQIIGDAMNVVRHAADAKGVRMECRVDPSAGHASCDPARVQQVLWNLISNAVKFTPKGGKVTISLERDRSTARIEVRDDGVGIAAEFLPYVFDRFRQADSSTTRKFGGLGLGLSIVKNLVELHGGSVAVKSEGLGKGSTFIVNLPVRAVQADIEEPVPAEVGPAHVAEMADLHLDGLRVAIVDDEADARRLLGKVLGDAGAVVSTASSVAEAMDMMDAARPEVLISDIAMPDEDGYDLIRRVRGSGRGAKILPAVALTAFAHKEDRRRVLMAGFQVHVAKPVDPSELVALVASLAGRTG